LCRTVVAKEFDGNYTVKIVITRSRDRASSSPRCDQVSLQEEISLFQSILHSVALRCTAPCRAGEEVIQHKKWSYPLFPRRQFHWSNSLKNNLWIREFTITSRKTILRNRKKKEASSSARFTARSSSRNSRNQAKPIMRDGGCYGSQNET